MKHQEGFSTAVAGTPSSAYSRLQGTASGTHTQVAWTTHAIEAEVADLKGRGVVFEEYDTPDLKTVQSVATIGPSKAAWFKDSEGNLLALVQFD